MSHKHTNLLRAIFHDPISGNIHWREIESLLRHLGASVASAHGARFHVTLNGSEEFLHAAAVLENVDQDSRLLRNVE